MFINVGAFLYSPTLYMTVWSYPQFNEAVANCKFDLVDGLYPVISNLCSLNVFTFTLIWIKLLDHIQNAPDLPKCFW